MMHGHKNIKLSELLYITSASRYDSNAMYDSS